MTLETLKAEIIKKESFLCVGLDIDLEKLPSKFQNSPSALVDFSKEIIEATAHVAVAYKPNIAFFETYGVAGMQALKEVIDYLNENYPSVFTIADAKRGDIGNTSTRYAKAYYETFGFDSITVAPYMGEDSVAPFLDFEGKYAIMLALTSNAGSQDFQHLKSNEKALFQQVLETSKTWQNSDRLMYVVGATQANALKEIRAIVPDSFLLVPGVGAQGGQLDEVARFGLNDKVGLLVNSSRSILYASQGEDYAQAAQKEAERLQSAMKVELKKKGIV